MFAVAILSSCDFTTWASKRTIIGTWIHTYATGDYNERTFWGDNTVRSVDYGIDRTVSGAKIGTYSFDGSTLELSETEVGTEYSDHTLSQFFTRTST